jgi:GAF domain-containing protein
VDTDDQNDDFQRLHELIEASEDLKGFLDGMCRYAATTLTRATGARIECAVTLHRRKRRATIAGSSDTAILLDGIEQALGDGPCLQALQSLEPVLLADTGAEGRWPEYSCDLAAAGARSVLGVPLPLGSDASAALNFFAPATGLFSETAISEAVTFADMAGQALRLANRIATADRLAEDLKTAMDRRTVIDVATGMIMSQNGCTKDEAAEVLIQASSNRNEKLYQVALDIINARSATDPRPTAHFED